MTTSSVIAILPPPRPQSRAVGFWLLFCAAWILAVTVFGGLTRLEHAGLSIPSWEPLAGVLPPLSQAEWEAEFGHYRQFPEYLQIHVGMDLAGFQYIFWFEYTHRMLARFLGAAILLPLIFFWGTGRVDGRFALKGVALLVLVGLQGALGWYMVASGLVDRPDVSHYRLTAHLGLAVILYGVILWVALQALAPPPPEWGEPAPAGFLLAAFAAVGLVYTLILSGGLVAGLDAGFAYNTFPKMDGYWLPPGLSPENPFASVVTVQFLHRWAGVLVAAYLILLWGRALDARISAGSRAAFHALFVAIGVQGLLGVATLLLAVPLSLGALHQAGALILLGVAIVAAFLTNRSRVRPAVGIHILP